MSEHPPNTDKSAGNAGFTEALAQMLSNRELRVHFRDDPQAVAVRLRVPDESVSAFLTLDPDQLDRQADCLVRKRFHEVTHLIPGTIRRLGPEAEALFLEFAATVWPEGHRRHHEDAERFCDWLSRHRRCPEARFEGNLLRFRNHRRKFAVHVVRGEAAGPRLTLQVLFQRKHHIREIRSRLF